MSQTYLIRCIMDTEEDVLRDIRMLSNHSLMGLHHAIIKAFELEPGEMSSFFKSNAAWEQGEEISMMDFDPIAKKNPLESTPLSVAFKHIGDRMLFAYDYLNLWTFYLELMNTDIVEEGKKYPLLVGKVGDPPEKAPEKSMKVEEDDFSEDEDYNDEEWH